MSDKHERANEHSPVAATDRVPVEVAVGVLVRREPNGRETEFLLTSRPEGKVYAGYWEFPGGKLEAARRSSRPCDASCTRNSASPSVPHIPGRSS